jgi:uncharacterized membrane protein
MTVRAHDRLRLALTLLGLAIAAYLTILHYDTNVPLVCSAGAVVDCEQVLSSASSMLFGVPVAAWGLAWFAVELALVAFSLRARVAPEPAWLRNAGLAWVLGGTAMVLWFVYQEIGVVGKICLWCTAIHVLVLALLVVQVVSDPGRHDGDDASTLKRNAD